MSSRRAPRPESHSHARPKGGLRARNVVLALGAITVVTGVGVTLATADGSHGGANDRVKTNAAADVPEPVVVEDAEGSASPLATPSASPSVTASPSPSVKPSAKPKPKATPSAAPRKQTKRDTSGSGGDVRPTRKPTGSGGSSNGAEAQVLALVNEERAAAGCSPLTLNPRLVKAADDYSDVMANAGVMSHTGPDGSTMTSRVEAAGYTWSTLGENIAQGQQDAASVMDAWMHSPGHKANILNCSFKEIGVGVHFGDGGPWWTQDFGAGR